MNEQLIELLEFTLLRIRSGQTLTQACSDFPKLPVSDQRARDWIFVRERILAGQMSAEKGVETYLRQLKVIHKSEHLLQKALRGPQLQVLVLCGVSAVFCVTSLWLAPQALKPSSSQIFMSATLLMFGYFWMKQLQSKFKKQLWPLIWTQILERIHAGLSWGRSFSQILDTDLGNLPQQLPPALTNLVEACTTDSKRALPLSEKFSNLQVSQTFSSPIDRAIEQLSWLAKLYDQGQGLSQIAGLLSEFTLESLEANLEKHSQTLAIQSLMPLFVCGLPAILILIFGGILRALRNF